ncbi:MAG TPA: response regulator [Xanthobacteraceae bacterium]
MARILVIDDEVSVRNSIQLVLEHRGHHVVAAECGRRHRSLCLRCRDRRYLHAGMDGFQTIKCLRRSAPKVAIIAISGYAFREATWPVPDFLKMTTDLGATCCLRKPFKAWELIKAVETSCAAPPIEAEMMRPAAGLAANCPNARRQA